MSNAESYSIQKQIQKNFQPKKAIRVSVVLRGRKNKHNYKSFDINLWYWYNNDLFYFAFKTSGIWWWLTKLFN